jgi:hypothetical protein
MFQRKVRFICPACGHKAKIALAVVREHEGAWGPRPGEPPEIECHWCHQGLMAALKYRFSSGQTFQLPRDVRRTLRSRRKGPLF